MSKYHKAAMSYFQAKVDEAEAVLHTYMHDSVGIGEHSEILKEIIKWTKELAEAQECLATLATLDTMEDQ